MKIQILKTLTIAMRLRTNILKDIFDKILISYFPNDQCLVFLSHA